MKFKLAEQVNLTPKKFILHEQYILDEAVVDEEGKPVIDAAKLSQLVKKLTALYKAAVNTKNSTDLKDSPVLQAADKIRTSAKELLNTKDPTQLAAKATDVVNELDTIYDELADEDEMDKLHVDQKEIDKIKKAIEAVQKAAKVSLDAEGNNEVGIPMDEKTAQTLVAKVEVVAKAVEGLLNFENGTASVALTVDELNQIKNLIKILTLADKLSVTADGISKPAFAELGEVVNSLYAAVDPIDESNVTIDELRKVSELCKDAYNLELNIDVLVDAIKNADGYKDAIANSDENRDQDWNALYAKMNGSKEFWDKYYTEYWGANAGVVKSLGGPLQEYIVETESFIVETNDILEYIEKALKKKLALNIVNMTPIIEACTHDTAIIDDSLTNSPAWLKGYFALNQESAVNSIISCAKKVIASTKNQYELSEETARRLAKLLYKDTGGASVENVEKVLAWGKDGFDTNTALGWVMLTDGHTADSMREVGQIVNITTLLFGKPSNSVRRNLSSNEILKLASTLFDKIKTVDELKWMFNSFIIRYNLDIEDIYENYPAIKPERVEAPSIKTQAAIMSQLSAGIGNAEKVFMELLRAAFNSKDPITAKYKLMPTSPAELKLVEPEEE